MFAALQGVASDGRAYIDAAIKAGAVAVLTDDRPGEWAVATVKVSEPRLALSRRRLPFSIRNSPASSPPSLAPNGKSSTVDFLRQIWTRMGRKAASMGTLGAIGPSGMVDLGHTTPDPVAIHATLDKLAGRGRDARCNGGVFAWPLAVPSAWCETRRQAPSPTSRRTTSTITRTSTTTAAPRCGCSPNCLPKGAPAIVNADSPELDAFEAVAREGRPQDVHGRLAGSRPAYLRSPCRAARGRIW